MRKWVWFGAVVAVGIVLMLTVAGVLTGLHTANTDEQTVYIPPQSSVRSSIDLVHQACTFPTPRLVSLTGRLIARVHQRTVQAGWYRFPAHSTQWDVLVGLFSGSSRPTVRVTIPEGLTYREIASLLSTRIEVDSAAFVQWCEDDQTLSSYGLSQKTSPTMEGYLMPDTYDFFWRMDASEVGDRLAREWQQRHQDSVPSYRELILASIVQAEAVNTAEMPRIAGVYTNRLKRGMTLAADPTVQYGLGDRRRLLYRDLAVDTPWNTYLHTGLPPTPINNPGEDAIRAARHPEVHDYLYFVARGDASGNHRFASNDRAHAENVRAYRRARARSK
ncbi:MAG: endolytic transglycosylase MltG [Candidatus Kapaibacteriota bacterium]